MRKITLIFLSLIFCCSVALAAGEDMKVGFIYVSPIGDAGWSFAHDQGRQAVDKMTGVSTSYVEAVAEGRPDRG